MRIVFILSLSALALTFNHCDSGQSETTTLPSVSDMSASDSLKLLIELIDSMRAEAKQNLDEACAIVIDDPPIICFDDRPIFEIKVNASNQLLIRGKPATFEDIEGCVFEFYTMNRSLTEKEIEKNIRNSSYEGYNYPFYSFITKEYIKKYITEENERLESARHQNNTDLAEFHENSIKEWKKKLFILEVIHIEELQEIHPQTQIRIVTQEKKTGWSSFAHAALRGVYRVRDLACRELFGKAYLDLFLLSKTTGKKKYKDQLRALEMLYALRIFDEPYLRSIDCKNCMLDPDKAFYEKEVVATPPPFDPID